MAKTANRFKASSLLLNLLTVLGKIMPVTVTLTYRFLEFLTEKNTGKQNDDFEKELIFCEV